MIKNNFNTLMAERQLKITRVSNDTGISRTTLTALSQEMSKGVQLDTLNTLCTYFNISYKLPSIGLVRLYVFSTLIFISKVLF